MVSQILNTLFLSYWILNNFVIENSIKSKLKFLERNWSVLLVLLESLQWIRFYGGNFLNFRPKMWDILSFWVIFVTRNSTKLPKLVLNFKEIS